MQKGTNAKAVGEVFVAEQPILIAGLPGQAHNQAAVHAGDTIPGADGKKEKGTS
jgi:hypothetical protein